MSSPRSPAPAVPLPDDEDILSEILLRLSSEPSSLPRASAVCKGWLRLVSDPAFFRRFRAHHRRNPPPILGIFDRYAPRCFPFEPTLDPPNRVPRGRFSLQFRDDARFMGLGCRHGLVLILHLEPLHVLVWDPITGDQHRLAIPPGFDILNKKTLSLGGAVLRTAGDVDFQVVLVDSNEDIEDTHAFARVYSSKTGLWGNLISTPLLLPTDVSSSRFRLPTMIFTHFQSVLVGGSLYWLLAGTSKSILQFDLDNQSLAVIPAPVDMYAKGNSNFTVMRAEGGGLGFLFLSGSSARLWKRKTDRDGVSSWALGKTIELGKLLSQNSENEEEVIVHPTILGFAEENNVLFVWTIIGLFMVQLESLQVKKLNETKILSHYHPFESVYTAGAMVLDMMELNFCTMHKMIVQLISYFGEWVEQVFGAVFQDSEMQRWFVVVLPSYKLPQKLTLCLCSMNS